MTLGTVATLAPIDHVGQVLAAWWRGRYDRVNTAHGRGWVPLEIEGTTYYTTAEAAAKLGLAHATVRSAIQRGVLEKVAITDRLNMVPEEALERYRRANLGRTGRPKGSRNKANDLPPEGKAPHPGTVEEAG